jgi:hypothetical protein
MPEIINEIPLKLRRHKNGKYDYDEMLDGTCREYVRGDDFTTPAGTFRTTITAAAQRRGIAVRTTMNKEKESVLIQALGARHDEPAWISAIGMEAQAEIESLGLTDDEIRFVKKLFTAFGKVNG